MSQAGKKLVKKKR